MKKKGFTLIELLAVIVILAILSLIATPIILNVVEDAKKGSKESSAVGYLQGVEEYQIAAELSGKKTIPDGTLSIDDLKQYDIEVKGETPIDGYVTIKNKQVIDYKLQLGDYLVSYNSKKNKGEATKEKIKGDYTIYNEGDQVIIDGISYHVIKNSSSYNGYVSLLRDESIGIMKFDENGGTNFETSTLKTYLNSNYKDTFGDKKQYIKEITLIDFGVGDDNKAAFENISANIGSNVIIKETININYNYEEGTYMYLYKKNYNWLIDNWNNGADTWTKSTWTNPTSQIYLIVSAHKPLLFETENLCLIGLGYSEEYGKYDSISECGGSASGPTIEGANVRPVIVISKEAL